MRNVESIVHKFTPMSLYYKDAIESDKALEEPEIRLRYSTIVNYLSMLYRLLSSLGFVVIIGRRLSVEEFGLWGIILSLLLMVSYFTSFWDFWSKRFHLRGIKDSFASGFSLTFLYMIPASVAYTLLAYLAYFALGRGLFYLMLGLLLLPLYLLVRYVEAMLSVIKPEAVGFRNIIYETFRLLFVFIFVIILNLGLVGALAAMGISFLISLSYGLYVLIPFKVISFKLSSKLVKEWVKGFHVPLLNSLANSFEGGLRAITSWITGSEVPVAYLNIGIGVQTPILRASWSSSLALYPRIMKYRKGEDITETLRIYLLITGFMFVSLISLSKGIVSLYNPKYLVAYPILIVVAIYSLILGLNSIFFTVLRGADEVDREGIIDYKKMTGSYLFKIPLLRLGVIALGYGLGITMVFLAQGDHVFEAVGMLSGLLISSSILLPFLFKETKRVVPHTFPLKEMLATVISSIVVIGYYYLSGAGEILVERFWRDAPILGLHLLLGGGIYLLIEYILSSWFRELAKKAIKHLFKSKVSSNKL